MTEMIDTDLKLFSSLSIGFNKNKYRITLKAKRFPKPLKNILLVPNPKMGKSLCQTKSLEAAKNNITIPKKVKGKKILVTPDMAFNPTLFEIITGIRKSSIKEIIGVLLKYMIFKLLAKYLKAKAEKVIK